jgi:phenylalanyl-tRNA synthetase beta chain
VPTRRPDLSREIDLIEEVARVHGIQQIPTTLPKLAMAEPPPPSSGMTVYRNADRARTAVCVAGPVRSAAVFDDQPRASANWVKVQRGDPDRCFIDNPLREELSVLRTRLLPGLVELLRQNLARTV